MLLIIVHRNSNVTVALHYKDIVRARAARKAGLETKYRTFYFGPDDTGEDCLIAQESFGSASVIHEPQLRTTEEPRESRQEPAKPPLIVVPTIAAPKELDLTPDAHGKESS